MSILICLLVQASQPVTVKLYESPTDRLSRESREYSEEVERAIAQKRHAAKSSNSAHAQVRRAATRPSTVQDLERLGVLRQRGLLSPSEFNAAKAKVLRK